MILREEVKAKKLAFRALVAVPKSRVWIVFLALAVNLLAPSFASALPRNFISLSHADNLNKAGIILIDPSNNQTLFSRGADKGRASASVLKLISMSSALINLGADYQFKTDFYQSKNPGEYVLIGNGDPWLAVNNLERVKYHRGSIIDMFTPTILQSAVNGVITLDCYGIYKSDIVALEKNFSKVVKIKVNYQPSQSAATALTTNQISETTSPKLSEIVKFTLLWSDNVLADRLARDAAVKMGYGSSNAGIEQSFIKVLTDLNVPTDNIEVFDGNGLSHKTRVSVRTLALLLERIRTNPLLNVIYQGLPLAGKTGTLQNRFTSDAPNGVGLIKAKTGWINNTVSLAGYVRRGSGYWIFAIIDDALPNNEYQRGLARIAIDKLLASIAYR
jgi:serine-type D-Ala-D-Ala carboxypeptidase/endopeptidase (penicillin-binding protein 4)